jgi:uncharacterized protein (DUF427 family)
MWRYTGKERPPFALEPAPGQESVWDYPRPPRIAPDSREVIVRSGSIVIAQTRRAIRILETASPPTFLIPPDDVDLTRLEAARGSSVCEWKGAAKYWTVRGDGAPLVAAAWSYPNPTGTFETIRDHLGFYPARFECSVDGIRVEPQPGQFYAGWITPEIVGPVKGDPGTSGW